MKLMGIFLVILLLKYLNLRKVTYYTNNEATLLC